nr:hypothetical protein [Tanacetum cinerariifolium]
IGGLSVRTENLEHALGKLTMKTIEVSDAQVKDSIAIGEIQPKGTISKSESHECAMISYALWMEKRLVVLEERLQRPPHGPR